MIKDFQNLINFASKKYKDKDYIISARDNSRNYSFNDLKKFKNKFNIFLENNKIKNQEKILIIMHNSDLLSLLFLTIISNSRIFVPVNPKSSVEEVNYIIQQTEPKILLSFINYKNKFNNLKISKKLFIESEKDFVSNILNLEEKKFKKEYFKNKSIAQILFTSGSTGRPKGVVLTQESIMFNLYGIKQRLNINDHRPRFLAVTPLFHNNGQFIPTLLPLLIGGTTTPIQSETSIINFWDVSLKKKINYSSVMATHINYFLKMNVKLKGNKIKCLFCGGAKLEEVTRIKFQKKFNIKVSTNYGLTETSSIVSSEGLISKERKKGSVGKRLFNNMIKIVKNNKYDVHGEVYVKGKNLFTHYLNNKKLSKSKFKQHWFKTGDLGYIDKKNFLFIKDRIDNMIIISGENIYPTEIERYLHKFKRIKLGVVSSLPDELVQNKLILVYEGAKKIQKDKFKKIMSKYISSFKIPKLIYHCNELKLEQIPKAPNQKILRGKLKNYLLKNKKLIKEFDKV